MVSTIFLWIAVICLVVALFPRTLVQQGAYLGGLLAIGISVAILFIPGAKKGPVSPGVIPAPLNIPVAPSPPESPVTSLSQQAATAFSSAPGATKAEAQELAALFDAFGNQLLWDDQISPDHPAAEITDTYQLGHRMAQLTRYVKLSGRPYGNKYLALEQLIKNEFQTPTALYPQGINPKETVILDPARKQGIAQIYKQVASGLRTIQ